MIKCRCCDGEAEIVTVDLGIGHYEAGLKLPRKHHEQAT